MFSLFSSSLRAGRRSGPAASFLALVALTLGLAATDAGAWGVTTSLLPRVPDARLDSALARSWRGLVKNSIDPWTDGLLHRPNSEMPGDAVSEGQAYGMILALYSGDQKNFNRIWDASEKYLWNAAGGYYDWRWNKGAVVGSGMATDADQDIALMLLFADSLVKKGLWTAHTSPKNVSYRTRALALLNTLWGSAVSGNFNLAPGAGWGGDAFVNPGYFSPASYHVFAKADPAHDWNAVANQCYAVIARNPGYAKGMIPDWMVPDGSYFNGSLGYNAYRAGRALYKDAIRVHWRLAMDWLWFGDTRAKKFLDSAAAFVPTPDRANFYTLDGALLPVTDTFRLGDGSLRSRREYSELTVGMWACAAFASKGAAESQVWADSLLAFLPSDSLMWGRPEDAQRPDLDGSTPNERYFEQFLGWFGASVLAGRFSNILDDLDDPNPALPLAWSSVPAATPMDLDLQVSPLTVLGRLNKAASWNVTIESYPAGQTWSVSGRSDTVKATWNGFDAEGKAFPQGWCLVKTSARGLPLELSWVWLGHHRDIRIGTDWIVVDDFASSGLSPNVGAWGSFNNASGGGTAKVGPLTPAGTGTDRALTYTYDLGVNGYQYCGLEWRASGWAGLSYTTKVRYRAKADHPTVVDLYLVQTDIGDDNYFHVLDTVGTGWKTFEHAYGTFTGRLGNRSGALDPTKATSIRWHVQADKCLNAASCVAGTMTVDDVHLGGNLAQMITIPAAKLAMPANPPVIGVAPRAAAGASLRLLRQGRGLVELSAPAGTRIRWVSPQGREMGRSVADAEGVARWTSLGAPRGLVVAVPEAALAPLPVVLR